MFLSDVITAVWIFRTSKDILVSAVFAHFDVCYLRMVHAINYTFSLDSEPLYLCSYSMIHVQYTVIHSTSLSQTSDRKKVQSTGSGFIIGQLLQAVEAGHSFI